MITDRDLEILTDTRWPYRFMQAEYEDARRRNDLGAGVKTNGIGQRTTAHLNLGGKPLDPTPRDGRHAVGPIRSWRKD